MAQFRTSTYATNVGGSRSTYARSEVYVSNYYNLIKALRETDKELLKEFRKRAKDIGKPVQAAIKRSIPSTPPIRGMRRRVVPGRLTWGIGKPAKSALIRLKNPRKFQKDQRTSLLSVRVGSPATVLADMGGKSNRVTGKNKITPVYAYSRSKSKFRQHTINGQGENMISALNAAGGASRYIWPGAEDAIPEARQQFQIAVDEAVETVNENLERVDGV